MRRRRQLALFLLLATLMVLVVVMMHTHTSSASATTSASGTRMRGVSPENAPRYAAVASTKNKQHFTCFDGSATISVHALNDDYCDCPGDGSDEPGTSACSPVGRFWCENAGHVGHYIRSSRVGDNVCDCCDGSDEGGPLSQRQCPDTCAQDHDRAEAHARKERQTVREALVVKREYLAHARDETIRRREELAGVEVELRGVEGELARAKAELESADAAYNRAKERVKAASIAAATKECPRTLQLLQQQVRTLRKRFTELSSHVDELKAVLETTGEESVPDGATDGTEETEHGVDDELWSRVHALVDWHRAANWTGITNVEGDEEQDTEVKSMPQVVNVPAPNTGGATIGNDDDDAAAPQPPSSIYEQYVRPLYDFMRSLFFGGMVMDDGSYVDLHALKVIADKARATHTTLKTTVSDLQSRQSTLITQRDRNYGPEGVFMKLEGQCVEFAAAEYVYEVCPFGEAVQKTSGGARIALLGTWQDWPNDNVHPTTFTFTDGDACWNGPRRSLTVHLRCGPTNRVVEASEPQKCAYVMEMTSPAVCEGGADEAATAEVRERVEGEHVEL